MIDLPGTVSLTTGRGGLPVLRVDAPSARGEIYLHGATVTDWTPAGNRPVLWLGRASRFAPDTAIRGGVPICFPWFGARAGQPQAPSHGFARLSDWSLASVQDDGLDVTVRLRLTDDEATRASAWPHRFEAVYTVVLGARLSLALQVTNRSDEAVVFEEALHTYLDVGDIRDVEVSGLEGAAFVDRAAGPAPVSGEPGPVRFGSETDRTYLDTRAPVTVHDPGAGRSVVISKDGSAATVVWNPWIDKAAALADFGDHDWKTMLCVEACNVGDAAVHLAPRGSHTMVATFELNPDHPPRSTPR
jgi:D-hexose-6-phosphate mutarotase